MVVMKEPTPIFHDLLDVVHVDEKWFYLTKPNQFLRSQWVVTVTFGQRTFTILTVTVGQRYYLLNALVLPSCTMFKFTVESIEL